MTGAAVALERPKVDDHMGLVHRVAQRFRWAVGASLGYEDLVQAGSIGLMKACELFEPERGSSFSSYAVPWIWHHVSREAMNQARTVRVPVGLQEKLRHSREGLPPTFSLDAPLGGDHAGGATRLDELAADDLDPLAELEAKQACHALGSALECLSERARAVLHARFWEERLLSDVAGPLGLSGERVRQIEAKGLASLRQLLVNGRKAR